MKFYAAEGASGGPVVVNLEHLVAVRPTAPADGKTGHTGPLTRLFLVNGDQADVRGDAVDHANRIRVESGQFAPPRTELADRKETREKLLEILEHFTANGRQLSEEQAHRAAEDKLLDLLGDTVIMEAWKRAAKDWWYA